MSRLESAISYVIPQSEQQPQHYAPGASCLTCELWHHHSNPNRGTCEVDGEVTDQHWSCEYFYGELFPQALDSAI